MKKRLALLQMDVHVNDVEYNYNRVQELLTQSLTENPDIIVYLKLGTQAFTHQMI